MPQAPVGKKSCVRDFWVLLVFLKVPRSARDWHRKNRRDRFFTSAGFARARRVNPMDGVNKSGMDVKPERQARASRINSKQEQQAKTTKQMNKKKCRKSGTIQTTKKEKPAKGYNISLTASASSISSASLSFILPLMKSPTSRSLTISYLPPPWQITGKL